MFNVSIVAVILTNKNDSKENVNSEKNFFFICWSPN